MMLENANMSQSRIKQNEKIGKIGDTIEWDFKDNIFKDYPKSLTDNIHTAEIAMVDLEEKHYGVYAEYGQDLIPFDKCKLYPVNKG